MIVDTYCSFLFVLLAIDLGVFFLLHRKIKNNRADINLIARNPAAARKRIKPK